MLVPGSMPKIFNGALFIINTKVISSCKNIQSQNINSVFLTFKYVAPVKTSLYLTTIYTQMRKHFFALNITLFCWLFADSALYAQVFKGQITDASGSPVSFATVFIRELKQGTLANEDGFYELRVPEGVYTCQFQSLGYETAIIEITIGAGTNTYNITLHEKTYELMEVTVSGNNREDRAYGIMRRAIAMAPYYLNQVSEYKADVYLKGSFQVIKISTLLKRLAREELKDVKSGDTYVEESFNEIEFFAPNKYNQQVLKRTGSMPNSENGSPMQLVTTNIYDPNAFPATIISPLSTSAFTHYRFTFEGSVRENDRIINKIKITPAHRSKQLMSGYIYIVDDYWNVHSMDVSGEFLMGINFRLQVNFGEVNAYIWMPISHIIDMDGSILGNKGAFHYVSSVKYNHIIENTSIRKPDALLLAEQQHKAMQELRPPPVALTGTPEPQSRTSARIDALMEKENLSNRDAYQLARLMQQEAEAQKSENKSLDLTATFRNEYTTTVDSAANERDTEYWEMIRPVPLTSAELKSYQEKEIKLGNSSQEKDSVNNKNRGAVSKVLFGTNIKLGENGGTLRYNGLILSKFGFNTVDGFYVGQGLRYNKNFTNNQLTITPEAVWAIDRKALMWNVNALLEYSPQLKRGAAQLRFGKMTEDFNNNISLPLENTISSLFFRRNYLKLYENSFVEAVNAIDITNGLRLNTGVKYNRRVMLDNTSDYSFYFRDKREYTPNIPVTELETTLSNHTAAVFTLNVSYTPQHYYRIVNNRKRYVRSDFPTFSATWQKGVSGVFNSNSDFDRIAFSIRQEIETGFLQRFNYYIVGGTFVNRKSLFFPDFQHFNTLEMPVTISLSQQSFKLLEYYRYSTSGKYFVAHAHYETPFLLLKFLPYIGDRILWREGVQLNYLHTGEIKNYTEFGYTIGGLAWRAGVFAGFENLKYRSFGFKLTVPVNIF